MIFDEEIDHQLDPDEPVLFEPDRNHVTGSSTDIARIMLRSIRAMSPIEKQLILEVLDKKMNRPTGVYSSRYTFLSEYWQQPRVMLQAGPPV